jgi:hypothetical protein
MSLQVQQKDGSTSIIKLHNCKYIATLPSNLFSITRALSRGWKISNNGIKLQLTKNHGKIIFDTVNPTATGCIMSVKMVPATTIKPDFNAVMYSPPSNKIVVLMKGSPPITKKQNSSGKIHDGKNNQQ